ncbi:MAG: diphthine--ammonia ligase [Ferroplasma sp.]
MKAVSLFSGGKDSFLASMIAMEQGYEIVYGVTIIPEEYSMMFHYPNASMSQLAASFLNFNIKYVPESKYENFISDLSRSGINAIITGAIASDYQKTRIEKLCYSEDVIVYSPLWRKKQEYVIEELILRKIGAIIVSVSAEGLTEKDLGSKIDERYYIHLLNLKKEYGINIAGEGGEYESFVMSLGNSNIKNLNYKKIWKNSTGYLLLSQGNLNV